MRRLLIAALFASSTLCAQTPAVTMKATQGSVPEQIELPTSAMQAILADTEEYPNETPSKVTCQTMDSFDAGTDATYRLLCMHVHLSPASNDLLVMGTGDYNAEGITAFWLFHNNKLVLKTHASQINVFAPNANGFAKVETLHMEKGKKPTAEEFLFNGTKYVKQDAPATQK